MLPALIKTNGEYHSNHSEKKKVDGDGFGQQFAWLEVNRTSANYLTILRS